MGTEAKLSQISTDYIYNETVASFLLLLSSCMEDRQTSAIERAIDVTASACADMSKSRTGALIVFERKILLDDVLRSGTRLDAEPSSELLKNIFLQVDFA